ncbi:ribonuclease III domain-containing protein [Dipodascopsis uninucleata]
MSLRIVGATGRRCCSQAESGVRLLSLQNAVQQAFRINNHMSSCNLHYGNRFMTSMPDPATWKFRSKALPATVSDLGSIRLQGKRELVEEIVRQNPALVALHARLNLPESFPFKTLARALICRTANSDYVDNRELAELGSRYLEYYVAEWMVCTYPRLPMEVIGEILWAYTGPNALASVGGSWGVEALRGYGKDEANMSMVDKMGFLKFGRVVKKKAANLKEYREDVKLNSDGKVISLKESAQFYNDAMSDFVRSVIGGIHVHEGRDACKLFIEEHIMSRYVNISRLFRFVQPTRELSRLCWRENLQPPVSRMISETGRQSRSPVYIVGVYSGSNLLGSGEGASIKEAETRAAINALKSWYLYSPSKVMFPSNTEGDPSRKFVPSHIDQGQVIV